MRWLLPLLLVGTASLAIAADEHRPFPQHTRYQPGTLPPSEPQAALDAAVCDTYRAWRQRYLRDAGPGEKYVFANADGTCDDPATRSVSEGHGYGMLIAVLMSGPEQPEARADFDALARFYLAHPTTEHPPLMAWRQVAERGGRLIEQIDDRDSATDGDLDIAYALLRAEAQWGNAGAIDYGTAARKLLAAITAAEMHPERHTLQLGNWVEPGSKYDGALRPSDFMPGHWKAFAAATGDPRWTQALDATYTLLAEAATRHAPQTGLLPDFLQISKASYTPAPPKFLEGKHDGAFGYNACRVPWRIGTDYLLTGDPRALALLRPMNTWARTATEGDPDRLNAGYRLDGHPLAEDESSAFWGPFAIAAMTDPDHPEWLNALWQKLRTRPMKEDDYYGNTIKLLTMIVVSGNWW